MHSSTNSEWHFIRTCVSPDGRFVWAVHLPSYTVLNLRQTESIVSLGHDTEGMDIKNAENFPEGDLEIKKGQPVYEICNPFPFWGATYILKNPSDSLATNPDSFRLMEEGTEEEKDDMIQDLVKNGLLGKDGRAYDISHLPRALKIALAQTSRDPDVLSALADISCLLEMDDAGIPVGISFIKDDMENLSPVINDLELFETLGNNPALPYEYKLAMVLKPGVQGKSPIVGEYRDEPFTHIWEYLRANSYIPWGHYASNMAHDCERYIVKNLSFKDIRGLRHLYYQRIYSQMCFALEITRDVDRHKSLTTHELDVVRLEILDEVKKRTEKGESLPFNTTLWGWNYGYDFSPSGYRLNASHQQIHQQFALVPSSVKGLEDDKETLPTYVIGDQVSDFLMQYKKAFGRAFFSSYISAIYANSRMDGKKDLPDSLIVYEDDHVLVFVPKSQRSRGEVQVITKGEVGNILEADSAVRASLDKGLHLAIKGLSILGAEMVVNYEVSKRFDSPDTDQRLFYCLLPRHPQSPGTFSEAQGRWVTGHYPEDYAQAFRTAISSLLERD